MPPRPMMAAPSHLWRAIGRVIIGSCLAAGCQFQRDAPASTSRDSVGIVIVESHRPVWPPTFRWVVEPTPSVVIGRRGGDPQQEFFRIRGAVRLRSGDVIVADGLSRELRWFDADGQFILRRGGEGSGPGEYEALSTLLLLPGDSIAAGDGLRRTVRLYTATGEFVRSWQVSPMGAIPGFLPVARLENGLFVTVAQTWLSQPPGHVPYQTSILRYRDGVLVDTVTQFLGGEEYYASCGLNRICAFPVPFGRKTSVATSRNAIMVGDGQRYEIRVFDPTASLTQLWRRTLAPAALSSARVVAYRESTVAAYPAARQPAVRRALEAAPVPDAVPAFVQFEVDALENFWVARFDLDEAGRRPWDVFGPDGGFLGTVAMPRGVDVLQVGGDFVLGTLQDADDVEYVVVLQLSKPSDPIR